MMKRSCCLAVALSFLATCCTVAFAEVPTYQPYGAWRGRIRYVEGPFRTRSKIHWGNGLTEVGGQVLMHAITVAGDVAANPNALSGITGRSLDEQRSINSDWNEIQTNDSRLRNKLNDLKKNAGLQGTPTPPAGGTLVPDQFPPSGSPSGSTVGTESLRDELVRLRQLVEVVRSAAKAYFDKVNAEDTRWKFAAAVLATEVPPTGTSAHAQLTDEWSDFQNRFKVLNDAIEAAKPLVAEWKSRIAEDDRLRQPGERARFPTASKILSEIDAIIADVAKWNAQRVE